MATVEFDMKDNQLADAYKIAMHSYEAAKAGRGSRVETFIKFLVAERALTARYRLSPEAKTRNVQDESMLTGL